MPISSGSEIVVLLAISTNLTSLLSGSRLWSLYWGLKLHNNRLALVQGSTVET